MLEEEEEEDYSWVEEDDLEDEDVEIETTKAAPRPLSPQVPRYKLSTSHDYHLWV